MFIRLRAIINILLGSPTIYRWSFKFNINEIWDNKRNVGGYIAESDFSFKEE